MTFNNELSQKTLLCLADKKKRMKQHKKMLNHQTIVCHILGQSKNMQEIEVCVFVFMFALGADDDDDDDDNDDNSVK